jgi:prepilin-type N-terminal cleavage/methylation domain-containing protein
MNRSPRSAGFTLIEMITVIAIIVILVALVLSVNGLVQRKGAQVRTTAEIAALSAGCENYKTDNGGYPQDTGSSSVTSTLDPRTSYNPQSQIYWSACTYLYSALSGDTSADGIIQPSEQGNKNYAPDFFKSARLAGGTASGTSLPVYMLDPYGNSYGYSTAGLELQQEYQAALSSNPSATMPTQNVFNTVGYNQSIYDLWSTGGTNGNFGATDLAKWVKNW